MENLDLKPLVEKFQLMIATSGLKILGAIALILGAWIVAGFAKRVVDKGLTKAKFDVTLTRFFASLTKYFILAIAFIACLGVFGIETTSFAAVIGAAGLAVGLAFQGTLGNIASGVMLLIFRPFKVGDFVKAGGNAGTVEAIGLFSTDLKTPDNRVIIIPNGTIFGNTIENVTSRDTRRVDVPVGVEYSADIDRTREVLNEAIKEIPNLLDDPAPQVFLSDLGDSSVNWVLRVWCDTPNYWDVHQATVRAIKMALDKHDIGIPFPQMDIHVVSGNDGNHKAPYSPQPNA